MENIDECQQLVQESQSDHGAKHEKNRGYHLRERQQKIARRAVDDHDAVMGLFPVAGETKSENQRNCNTRVKQHWFVAAHRVLGIGDAVQ